MASSTLPLISIFITFKPHTFNIPIFLKFYEDNFLIWQH